MNQETAIDDFSGPYFWLSNFYPSPIDWEGDLYITVENAFQAAKTLDRSARGLLQDCGPDEAKLRGGQLALRGDWEQVKVTVMTALLREKFAIPALARRLLETGERPIVNRNVFGDTFWGQCRGQGANHLGVALMTVRAELKTPQKA